MWLTNLWVPRKLFVQYAAFFRCYASNPGGKMSSRLEEDWEELPLSPTNLLAGIGLFSTYKLLSLPNIHYICDTTKFLDK